MSKDLLPTTILPISSMNRPIHPKVGIRTQFYERTAMLIHILHLQGHQPWNDPSQLRRRITDNSRQSKLSILMSRSKGSTCSLHSLRMSTMPVSGNGHVTSMPSSSRLQSSPPPQDWRMYLTIEERQAVRSKIQDAYSKACSTYEDLLQAVHVKHSYGFSMTVHAYIYHLQWYRHPRLKKSCYILQPPLG
jgi:hypothetical protein